MAWTATPPPPEDVSFEIEADGVAFNTSSNLDANGCTVLVQSITSPLDPIDLMASHAIASGQFVYTSLFVSQNPSHSVSQQTTDVLLILESLFQQLHGNRDDFINVDVYLTDPSYIPAMNSAWSTFFSGHSLPARVVI